MKLNKSWLDEWAKTKLKPSELAHALTMAGLEVDSIEELNGDTIIDIDLTPNRADCLSVAGIARELHALTDCQFTPIPENQIPATISDKLDIKLLEEKHCPRYVGRIIRGIRNGQSSPAWLRERLEKCGVQSVSVVVDVTNYVMLELGQPMHAFDLAKIEGDICVRFAKTNEKLTLLDEKEVEFKPETLVIADSKKVLAMAGVMGGLDSGVTESTQDVLLESAFFNPVNIALRSRQYGVHSDSSFRFSRGVDPYLQVQAIERATALLLDIVGGEAGPVFESVKEAHLPKPAVIKLRPARVKRLLGLEFAEKEMADIFKRLQMKVKQGDVWQLTAPNYRFDMAIEEDLIEELARVRGYDKIPSTLPQGRFQPLVSSETTLSKQLLSQTLQACGYHEMMMYSFVDAAFHATFEPEQKLLEVSNPVSSEMSAMRHSLWPSLIKVLTYNLNRQCNRLKLFEFGSKFTEKGEISVLSGLVSGAKCPEQWGLKTGETDFFDVKADLELIFSLTHQRQQFVFKKASHPSLHPGQTAEIFLNGQSLGYLGALHPKVAQKLDLSSKVLLFELSLQPLRNAKLVKFRSISKFPSVRRDLAFTLDEKIEASQLTATVKQAAGEHLEDLLIFDVYQGKGVQAGQKSVAFGLILQDSSRTLNDEEVNKLVDQVIKTVQDEHNATLRM